MKSLNSDNCVLCSSQKYPIIWANDLLRIVLINDQNYRGYCRVDLINHVKEMADLDEEIRNEFMGVIFQMEKIIKEYLQPDKINLASLGNITPTYIGTLFLDTFLTIIFQIVFGVKKREMILINFLRFKN